MFFHKILGELNNSISIYVFTCSLFFMKKKSELKPVKGSYTLLLVSFQAAVQNCIFLDCKDL